MSFTLLLFFVVNFMPQLESLGKNIVESILLYLH